MGSFRRTGESLPRCPSRCGACTARCHRAYQGQMSLSDALEQLFQQAEFCTAPETVPLREGLHRICAEDLCAAWDIPTADCAGHDGIAFRWEEARSRGGVLLPGQYALLGMGRPLPAGFDTLAPYELLAFREDGSVMLKKLPVPGEGMTRAGAAVTAGQPVVRAGTRLGPSVLALLRSVGIERVPVWRKPKAAVLPVGADIVPEGVRPGPGQFADGDSLLFQLMVEECGGTAEILPVLPDEKDSICGAVLSAAERYDLILLSGGAGNGGGSYGDYAAEAVSQAGKIITHGISIRPGGKATLVAVAHGKPVIGFPGPMHAALLMAEQLLPPVLARFLHQKEQNRVVEAVSTGRFPKRDGDAAFMPHVLVSQGEGGLRVSPVRMGDNPDTFVQANGVALLEPGREYIPGETIQVQLLPHRDASPEENA